MRALLDVNVLIALFDSAHAFHDRAHEWWSLNRTKGWASCPLTENGFVRIISNPTYSAKVRFSAEDLIKLFTDFAQGSDHEFWPDDISLRDGNIFAANLIHSSRQITDLYLLALAVRRRGRLATFDTTIPRNAISSAHPENLYLV